MYLIKKTILTAALFQSPLLGLTEAVTAIQHIGIAMGGCCGSIAWHYQLKTSGES
jgi:hypothetical protein